MMEKESPSQAPPGVFNASCDGDIVNDMPNLASDDTRMRDNCFKSSYATSAAADNNSWLTHAEDFSFVENKYEEKQSGDLLYYGLPDIGKFEDVDKMLRSCDSSFGLGVTDNDNELCWFTSGQTEGAEEAIRMDFKILCPESSVLKNITHPDHDSPEPSNRKFTCISERKNELYFKDQKKQSKHQNQTQVKKAGQAIGNDHGSFYQLSDLTGNGSELSINNQTQYRYQEIDYYGHIQSNSYLHPDHPHQTTAVSMLSGSKSEHMGLKSTSPMSSSYASNQGRSTESSIDPSFEGSAAKVDEQKQSCNSQRFQKVGMRFQSSKGVSVSVESQGNLSLKEHESESDNKGAAKGVEIGSLNVQKSSSICSELDKISLEAASYRQLRQVMEQLDLSSKICIRDSLYRLARSADQRHNNPSLSSRNDLGGPESSIKCTGFMDIETDTNPIDRSVAHLLFHRPSESLKLPTTLPPNSNPNLESIPGPSMLAEKLLCQEEAAAESNDTIWGN